ncbi:uncharacterized protein LOC109419656 [Aedes albopictus]|uniref:RRM domain-containing protein n=1 Tax=Aedes albopictus TaxID=7160 RepID=A0ABM1YQ54_AEDAL
MSQVEKKTEQSTGEHETDTSKGNSEYQRRINVANLPWDVTEQQLRNLFSDHEVEKVDIYHYRRYTVAAVLFKNKETKAAALAGKENFMFGDRRLRMYSELTYIRYIKRELVVTAIEDENMTEEQLWDKVKAAGVEPTSVLIFYPLGYVTLEKDCDKPAVLEKLKAAGFNAHDVNQRDQNHHLDIWREATLFFRNRNRVQLLNIPSKWIEDKEEMKKQCAEGGTIIEAVTSNAAQNPSVIPNYARIFYETEEQAAKAAKALNGRVVEGKRIHALYPGIVLMPNYKTSVYVTSLSKGVTEEQVYDYFKQFGEIEFTSRRNCGDAAIICFKNAASVDKALACTTFPAPTEENKDATKEVVVKKYDGPLVLRPFTFKRKLESTEGEKVKTEKTKEQRSVLHKLKAYHPIYVGNVPFNCPPLELKQYFAQHGPIKFMFSPQIFSYRNSAPHPVKTFIVYYMNRESQQNAVRFFDHKFFGGHRLHVLPLRGAQCMDVKKTIKMTQLPSMSEDALFKKIKPFVGKINRIVKKVRFEAFIELEDTADVVKLMKTETPNHPLPKSKMEQLTTPISVRLYDEDDVRILNGIAKIVEKNPDMLKKTVLPLNKRPRMDFGGPGFNQGPGGFNPNMNNPNAIQDLLRLAFLSGKNVGESLASNQSSFGSDSSIANSTNFGDGSFGNRNRNSQGGNQGNIRGQGKMNQNSGGNNNAGGNNFQGSPGNQNRGGQNMNRVNQQNQNRSGIMNTSNMNQSGGNFNRPQQNKPMNMKTGNQNRNNQVGGFNMNRNQNNSSFDNDNSFGGGNNFGNNRSNNFSNDSFGIDDNNFDNNGSNNFSNDNYGGNTSRNFGGNMRNQNDNFNSFGSGNNSGSTGGNNRFINDGNNYKSSFNNRSNQNNSFDNGNNFSGNKGGNFGNRQNKSFNQSGNQGGGMSFGEFNSNNSNRSGNFGANNSGFSPGNAGGNKWNNNSQQSNTGSRLAGSIFSRRF